MKLKDLIDEYGEYELEELVEELKEPGKPSGRWKPNPWGRYYSFINDDVFSLTWVNSQSDRNRYNHNNCFKTEKEAYEAKKVFDALEKYCYYFTMGEWKRIDINKYYLIYGYNDSSVDYETSYITDIGARYYFWQEEDIQAVIDEVGEEALKKYYFGVET